jgi:hypothetical protein
MAAAPDVVRLTAGRSPGPGVRHWRGLPAVRHTVAFRDKSDGLGPLPAGTFPVPSDCSDRPPDASRSHRTLEKRRPLLGHLAGTIRYDIRGRKNDYRQTKTPAGTSASGGRSKIRRKHRQLSPVCPARLYPAISHKSISPFIKFYLIWSMRHECATTDSCGTATTFLIGRRLARASLRLPS